MRKRFKRKKPTYVFALCRTERPSVITGSLKTINISDEYINFGLSNKINMKLKIRLDNLDYITNLHAGEALNAE